MDTVKDIIDNIIRYYIIISLNVSVDEPFRFRSTSMIPYQVHEAQAVGIWIYTAKLLNFTTLVIATDIV